MAGESDDREESRDLLVSRRLRSKGSYLHSYIRFVNCTKRLVDIVWLNHEGVSVRYKTLPSQNWVDVNTYVGHPWIFRDAITGDKLVVQLKEVFEPPAHCFERDGALRRVVMITIPVYSLKECALQSLRPIVPAHHIDHLELPRTLIMELKNSLKRNRFLSSVKGRPTQLSRGARFGQKGDNPSFISDLLNTGIGIATHLEIKLVWRQMFNNNLLLRHLTSGFSF